MTIIIGCRKLYTIIMVICEHFLQVRNPDVYKNNYRCIQKKITKYYQNEKIITLKDNFFLFYLLIWIWYKYNIDGKYF